MDRQPIILTEGAIVERLMKEFGVELDPDIRSASLIYEQQSREVLEKIYREYIDTAKENNLPIMLMTSTRRGSFRRIQASVFRDKDVIGDNVKFLKGIRDDYPNYKDQIYIGGILGCKGDAYDGSDALSIEESVVEHQWQVQMFKDAGVDFMFACIMPALSEVMGMAKLMDESQVLYIVSFMIRKNGRLLDGTTIHDGIISIDHYTCNKPMGYMVNCVHPKVLQEALAKPFNQTKEVRERFIGIQANTSSLSPEELEASVEVKEESIEELIDCMIQLYKEHHLKVLGGCCGTTNQHISALGQAIRKEMSR